MAPSSEVAQSASTSLLERTQNLWSEHKKAIIIGGSIGVAATALYCYATMSSSGRPPSDSADPEGSKKKKKRSQKKKAKVEDGDGPVIEEVTTAVDEGESSYLIASLITLLGAMCGASSHVCYTVSRLSAIARHISSAS